MSLSFDYLIFVLNNGSLLLQEFGHHVRLASHANFRNFVRSAGVEFYPLGGDPRALAGCKRFLIYKLFQLCYQILKEHGLRALAS